MDRTTQPWRPTVTEPYPAWVDRLGDLRVLLLGREKGLAAVPPGIAPEARRVALDRALEALAGSGEALEAPAALAEAKQIHSSHLLEGAPGFCGEGDALWTTEPDLAVSVITADCVPVLLAAVDGSAASAIAAVHAGWRGIAGSIVPKAVERLAEAGAAPENLAAWIGPSIGACCYEVGEEVVDQVKEALAGADGDLSEEISSQVVVRRPGREKPHLDVLAAAREQLRQAGVRRVRWVDTCTRCHPESLWSYRREGPKAGRNLAFIWRRSSE